MSNPISTSTRITFLIAFPLFFSEITANGFSECVSQEHPARLGELFQPLVLWQRYLDVLQLLEDHTETLLYFYGYCQVRGWLSSLRRACAIVLSSAVAFGLRRISLFLAISWATSPCSNSGPRFFVGALIVETFSLGL
jgi:hypothetical protein